MSGRALRRLVGAVTRRPLLVLGRHRRARAGRRGAGAAARAERGHRHARRTAARTASRTPSASSRTSAARPILVLVHGDLSKHGADSDLGRLLRLEGCLGGNVPGQQEGARQPAAGLPRDRGPASPRRSCTGRPRSSTPRSTRSATSSRSSSRPPPGAGAAGGRGGARAVEAARRSARGAAAPRARPPREAVQAQFINEHAPARRCSTGSAASRASTTRPSCPRSCSTGPPEQPGVPKSRFAYLFPSKNAALIQIRLRPDLTDAEQRARDRPDPGAATGEKVFKPRRARDYIVTRRAGGGGGAGRRRAELDLRPARSGAAC